VEELQATLPELPDARQARFGSEYRLSPADAALLAADRDVADYFEGAVAAGQAQGVFPKTVANWITGELFRLLKDHDAEIGASPVTPEALAGLIGLVDKGTITANSGKKVLDEMYATGREADEIVAEKGLAQVSDEGALAQVVDEILAINPEQVARYQGGKETLLQWFVGQVMRATRGKANPQVVMELLKERLHPDQ
jgi:aspartyl-tRNA(Asn)/glutamyl-tRNA(Gln) amidotransferase subunit B